MLVSKIKTFAVVAGWLALANIVVIDPDAHWTVVPAALASKSSNTPYAERTFPGVVVHTMHAGRPTVIGGALA